MASKYNDTFAVLQVIGSIYKFPHLLDDEKYFFHEEDFVDRFHKTIFGSIYNLRQLGAKKIDVEVILEYLSNRPLREAEFKAGSGEKWLEETAQLAEVKKFDYYYNRLKKMTLLRAYDNFGLDVTWMYDPINILSLEKKQAQEEWLDSTTLEEMATLVQEKVDEIVSKNVDSSFGESAQAGDGIFDLINRLKETPEVGVPLYGDLINTITRGARLKKFYLRSAATGTGKTRSMVADACNIACNEIYDDQFGWIKNGTSEPTLFITTEQELEEIQTMMLAFISNVEEDTILNGTYQGDEEERVLKAAKILSESPLYVEELPDFSLKDIENTIKRNIRDKSVGYVFDLDCVILFQFAAGV